MLITRVELKNHPGVGDVALDFRDAQGAPYRTIVLAGGNGAGKTAVLDAIQTVLEGRQQARIGTVTLHLMFEADDRAALMAVFESIGTSGNAVDLCSNYQIEVDTYSSDWQGTKFSYLDGTGQRTSSQQYIAGESWQRLLRSFYSEANVNFASETPKSITSSRLDDASNQRKRSGNTLAEEITQLLIDIRSADSEDLSVWVDGHPGQPVPDNERNVRFSRFADAFASMFPAKRFKQIRREGGLVVEFQEHGRTSSINQLSTGEKQIVFRAGFLLRSLLATKGSIVLIDEPELSLHPDWQSRIMGFYERLLHADGIHPQIIAATHSPFIVHGSIGAKTIVLEKNATTGRIAPMPDPAYPIVKGEEAVRAFNIDAFLADATKPILLLLEGRTDVQLVNAAWQKLRPDQPRPFEARDFLGARNITHALKDDTLYARVGDRIVVGLYDFDDAFNQWHGVWKSQTKFGTEAAGLVKRHPRERGYAALLPVPSFRSDLASLALAGRSIMSIEFLFADAILPPGLVERQAMPEGQSLPRICHQRKAAFAQQATGFSASDFAAFEPLMVRIEDIQHGRI